MHLLDFFKTSGIIEDSLHTSTSFSEKYPMMGIV